MNESECQSESQNQRREKEQLAQPAFPVAPAEVEVEPGPAELADGQKAIQADVDQKQFIEGSQSRRPGCIEPAQVDGKAEQQQNNGVPPVAGLLWVGARCLLEQGRNHDRKRGVERKPAP